jgi:STE24 endopeptidase
MNFRQHMSGAIAAAVVLAVLSIPHDLRAGSGAQAGPESTTQNVSDRNHERVAVPPPTGKALSYYRSGNVLWWVNVAWGLLIPVLFLFTGFSARLRNLAQRLGRKWFFVIAVYVVLFTLINSVISLPLTYYEEFARQHAYGLSNQTFGKWFSDSLKSLAVGLIAGVLFLWVPYLLLRRSPRRWWLYSALLSIPFLIFVMLVSPIWIDPLFNRLGPMKDRQLERKILELADRAGIEGSRVFEVDKSVDTKAVNAYVTGFGGTKRIVLWDTLLAKLNSDEVLVVMAHEMGHYVLGHVVSTILFGSVLVIVTLYVAWQLSNALILRHGNRFGFDRLSDIASLPLLILLVDLASLAVSPAALAFSRYHEHEADRFALEITRSNHAAATAFVKLQEENLGVPRPGLVYKIWRASHPPIGERIDFCNEYRPWETGEPSRYASRFKPPLGQ